MPTRVMEKDGVEICTGDERFLMGKRVGFKDDEREKEEKRLVKNLCVQNISCSDESSSIGKNSDLSENSMEKSEDGEEAQSSYKGAFDAMEALEEVLPIRRGISRFYTGKSKSFASLAYASSSSSSPKHLSKPDDPYSRRRRNLLSYSLTWDKNRVSCLRSNGGGISKRVKTSNRTTTTTLALAVAMSNSGSSKKQAEECNSSAGSLSVSSPGKDFSTWRSFSLADLQQCTNPDQSVTKLC